MKLEQINPINLTLEEAIKNQYSLYYIVEGDETVPYKFLSFSKEGLALPTDNYILVKITGDSIKKVEPIIHKVDNVVETKTRKKRIERDYKFSGMNDKENIRIEWAITGNKYGGIRVSFPNKEDAIEYYDYFREQFYSRDISSVNVASIYEDLGVSKERIEKECPNAWKWGYQTIFSGPCKYMTNVLKNKNDKWYGFTFMPPVITNGMEESGWYAKQKELDQVSEIF